MASKTLQLLLADDDEDDCAFFAETLNDLPILTNLTTVHNGNQLMKYLTGKPEPFPDVLFLDINLPLKNGVQCLSEIKGDQELKRLMVIIITTSSTQGTVDFLYTSGAHHYIIKPPEFSSLKKLIYQALTIISTGLSGKGDSYRPLKEKFLLTGNL